MGSEHTGQPGRAGVVDCDPEYKYSVAYHPEGMPHELDGSEARFPANGAPRLDEIRLLSYNTGSLARD